MYEDALARVDLFSGLRYKELTPKGQCASPGQTDLVERRKFWRLQGWQISLAKWRCWMICLALLLSRR